MYKLITSFSLADDAFGCSVVSHII